MLARWTTHFDYPARTDFWYCILDKPFDISAIKSKKRYYIKKGIAAFEIRMIDPENYFDELYRITDLALQTYDDYKKPQDKEQFIAEIKEASSRWKFLGAFFKEDNQMQGYIKVCEYEKYVDFMSMKANPLYEKKQINAALVNGLCAFYKDKLANGAYYICDGMRAINHNTNFQEYLEKNFTFRKAYCRLHMAYRPSLDIVIKVLFPFRKYILKWECNSRKLLGKLIILLKYEMIARNTAKQIMYDVGSVGEEL